MAENSKIEWTDATWNPITGCSVVSPGCTNCYAMKLAGTRLQHHPSRAGLTRDSKAGPVWTGEVRLNEDWLDQPLRWKRPRRIFVCAHGDLFHESVPDQWIDRVFAIMAAAPHHTFQVLTKRAARMRQYFSDVTRLRERMLTAAALTFPIPWAVERRMGRLPLPIPNVWLGVSAEDQQRADERIPDLLATPAAVHFVSAEPLLGPINLLGGGLNEHGQPRAGYYWMAERQCDVCSMADQLGKDRDLYSHPINCGWRNAQIGGNSIGIDWVIAGGESGPGARPMDAAWARSVQAQCMASGVAFFMKQMSKKAPIPEDLNVREFPNAR